MKKYIFMLLAAVTMLVSCSKQELTPYWQVNQTEKAALNKEVQQFNPFTSDIINGDTVNVRAHFNKNLINGKSAVIIYLSRSIDVDVTVRYWYQSNLIGEPPSIAFDVVIPKGSKVGADLFPNYYSGSPVGGGWLKSGSTGRWILK